MSLVILSNQFEQQEITFKNVAYASLNARLMFYLIENSLKEDGTIEIWVSKRYGNGENDYDSFSMDIHNKNWSTTIGPVDYQGEKYYSLAGTDNTPPFICYNFSLQYLRLCPDHLISIYDFIFNLDEIEQVEKNEGWHEDWLNTLKKNRENV